MHNTRWALEFVRVAKKLAGVVDFRAPDDAFCVAGAGASCFVMSMFANFGFRNEFIAGIMFAWQLQEFSCLGWTFWCRINTCEAPTSKSLKHIVILTSSVQSTCHFWRKPPRKAGFLNFTPSWRKNRRKTEFLSFKPWFVKEISQKNFVFWASKLHVCRKSCRNVLFLSFQNYMFEALKISNQLTIKPLESEIKPFEDELTTASLESQSNDISNQLTFKNKWMYRKV